ncbi:protein phosphatase 1 regulatory subunit 3A isoform X2 [Nannospalax galili]|uniref:protein phosphatase 1 regulatory subunit 3A isoform X2 n=1 Tax=Nannospalax galili TaxID=1026970 RepID=UPI0004ED08D7|nr:protein phosphatase 1 regulatory subunit 3A isoform X2 [Nannospalax galili]
MEPAEVPGQISKDNFLEVPNLSDSVCEDEDVKGTFKLDFSPHPSRRGSESSEDMYLDTPTSSSRKVSFADSLGFSLVSIKEFDCWDLPSVSTDFDLRKDVFHTEEYVLSPSFDLPSSKEDLMKQLKVQKAMLESTEYLPGSTCMKGIIRVLNISFEKLVYVRMSLDDWHTHYDILAEYVPNSCDGETDQFSFKISLVPPYQKDGSKVEFCIRYETSVGTFWSNNNGTNYILICQKKKQEAEPVKPLEEASSKQIKGCLKVKSSKEESLVTSEDNNFENLKITDTYIPTIICSDEEKHDLGASNQNVKDINREYQEHNEEELDLMINQRLITGCAASQDEKPTFSTDPVNFTNKAEASEKKQCHDETHTDLFKGPLFLSSSAESSLKKDFSHSEKYSSGNDCSPPPSEEIISDVGEIRPSLGDTSSDELVQSHISTKEFLDDNANPAHWSGRVQISCFSSDQLTVGNLNKNHEEGAKKIGIKDWGCSRRECCSAVATYLEESNGSSKGDYGKGKDVKQRTCLGVNEKQSRSFHSILYTQEKQMDLPRINPEGAVVNQDLTILPSKGTTSPSWAAATDPSTKTKMNCREAVFSPHRHLSTGESTLEPVATCDGSPRNGNVLMNDYLFHVEKEKSDASNPEDLNKNTKHKKNWKVLESQREARESKTNITEQTKEQADCKDMWEKRASMRSLKATPTEPLFTCQETECCELSPLADHGITEKAEALTAYIIKTTLGSTPESMSARGRAIIAKLPQETARSDRPMEVKETAFDPHKGRNDDSHYTLCHRDTAGVIHDNDFEKESHLDICNVHVDEMEKEETVSTYNPRKIYDREKLGAGIEQPSQVITGTQTAMSKMDLHLRMLSTDKNILPENKDLGPLQELSNKRDLDALQYAFNSDTARAPWSSSAASSHHTETSVPASEEKTLTTKALQSIPTNSDYNCNPISGTQGYAASKLEGVSESSEIMEADNRRERHVGQIFQRREGNVEKSQEPMILASESLDNLDEARHENEGLENSGQSQCSSSDKGSESSASASLPTQESQARSRESLFSKYINSKISYFLLFLIFLVTIYYYDLMMGLAFYLFSLYWLYWEGGRQRESVKKK